MKREVLVAILVGTGIGLIFTYGIWLADQSLKNAGVKPITTPKVAESSPTPTAIVAASSSLIWTSPEPYLLTKDKSIVITGQKEKESSIVILTENSQYILPASSSSTFSQNISLDSGYNRLKIISLNQDRSQNILDRIVTYSNTPSVFSDSAQTSKISPSASPSTTLRDSVREKVAQEIAQIRQNSSKKAYLGSITSKQDATLTIQTVDNLSKQISTTAETVIKLKNNNEGTFADLRPGDFLLAMGDADANGNILARRILLLEIPVQDKRQVLSGEVKSFTNKTLTLESTILNISKETVFVPAKYKFKDINPGFKLIAVYTPTSTPLIYVVSEK